jgi:topoisomerase IA-like protein
VKDFGNGFKAVMSKKGPLLLQEFVGKAEKADKAEKSEFFGWPPGVSFDQITEESARAWLETRKESQAPIGMFEDQPIEKKKGPYGYYYQCGTLRVPAVEGESMSEIVSKLSARKENSESNSKVGPYIFAKGKFGPYMYKADLKQKTFVSIPAELDPSKLTVADADALYKNGLEAKKAAAAAGRGGRGGARGARGGRGGRGGRV